MTLCRDCFEADFPTQPGECPLLPVDCANGTPPLPDEDRITALVHDISCNNLSPAHKTHPQAWCRLIARRLIAEVPLTLPTEPQPRRTELPPGWNDRFCTHQESPR